MSPSGARRATVLVVGDPRRPGVEEGIARHRAFLDRHLDVRVLALEDGLDLTRARADLVLVFGGDGSILHVARCLGTNAIPVLGVNFGRFGFLADLEPEGLEEGVRRWMEGGHATSRRMRLRVRVAWESGTSEEALALNDVVVGREALGRMVDLEVRIDGRRAVGYSGDGLIVATATGSTAHALAAGGPLLEPSVGAFVLVPIAPHALATRPLVLPSTHAIEVAIAPGRGGGCVTVDGAPPLPLGPGDRVQVEDARAPLTLVHASGASFYDALRRKLGWRGRPLSAGPAVDEGPREEPGEARRAAGVP